MQHYVPKPYARNAGDMRRLLRGGVLRCDCGGTLEGEGTPAYEQLAFEVRAQQMAAAIRVAARPTPRSKVVAFDVIENTIAHNNAQRARELAHDARKLDRELTWEFDTDAAGRPLN
jgi:hypothetical protein